MRILWPLMIIFSALIFSATISFYPEVSRAGSLKDGVPHWYSSPYDLKYDARWTHFPHSKVKFNSAREVVISGRGDYSSGEIYGARFAISNDWEKYISGHKVRVTLIVRSSIEEDMPFKVSYSTNDSGQSGWHYFVARQNPTEFSFIYKVPKQTKSTKDLVVIVPGLSDVDLILSEAYLELIDE